MKHEDALILRSFKNHCTCGGYAWHLNARNPANPHFDWCPQREEYQEWWEALHASPSHEVPDFEGIQECFMNEKAENRARIAKLQARLETMIKWLMLIDGGDNPCTDIDLLRKYAMLALRGEEPPNE